MRLNRGENGKREKKRVKPDQPIPNFEVLGAVHMSKKNPRSLQICIPKRDYLPENQVIWQIFSSMCTGPYNPSYDVSELRMISRSSYYEDLKM